MSNARKKQEADRNAIRQLTTEDTRGNAERHAEQNREENAEINAEQIADEGANQESAERNAEETTEPNAKEAAEQNAEENAERWGLERITTISKMKCVLKEEREMITIDEINAQISLLPKTMISCIRQAGGNRFHA